MISCDAKGLVSASTCFRCVPRSTWRAVRSYLLCQWANASNPPVGTCIQLTGAGTASINQTYFPIDPTTYQAPNGSLVANVGGAWVAADAVTGIKYYSDLSAFPSVWIIGAGSGAPNPPTGAFVVCPTAPAAPVALDATSITNAGFSANWSASSGATGYRLDVSTDPAFGSFVGSYNNLDVGNVLTSPVTGLTGSTAYHYRIRAYNASGTSSNSNVIDATTLAPCVAQPANLVAWYRAENNVLDWMGNANGTAVGSIVYVTGQVPSKAFSFTGSGSPYVSMGYPAPLALQTFTIELWRKRAASGDVGPSHYGQYISWGGFGGYNFYEIGTFNPNGQIVVGKYGQSNVLLSAGRLPQDTNWHHVACAIDSVGLKAYLWIDGAPDANSGSTIAAPNFDFLPQDGNTGLFLPSGVGDGFAGSIDELSIYSRVLSNAEILAIYNGGANGKCTA